MTMTSYVRYYKDDSAEVEYTNYVDLSVMSCAWTIDHPVEVILGDSGSNTYKTGGTRYMYRWVITADVDRRTHDFLAGCAIDTFDGDTTLRVYDKYAADYYNNYTGVKLIKFHSTTSDGGGRYEVTLTVVK